jgi:hypothetical protein
MQRRHLREAEVQLHSFLTSALYEGVWNTSSWGCSTLGKEPGCPLNRKLGGPHSAADFDVLEKRRLFCLCQNTNPGSLRSQLRHDTYCAIAARLIHIVWNEIYELSKQPQLIKPSIDISATEAAEKQWITKIFLRTRQHEREGRKTVLRNIGGRSSLGSLNYWQRVRRQSLKPPCVL